jgi:hypothetical protein
MNRSLISPRYLPVLQTGNATGSTQDFEATSQTTRSFMKTPSHSSTFSHITRCWQRLLLFALTGAVWIFFSVASYGQSPQPTATSTDGDDSFSVVISYGNGQSIRAISDNGVMRKVGLRSNQIVAITIQFPTNRSGQSVTVRPLDGGRIVTPAQTLSVGRDGTVKFGFQANQYPGLTQVSVELGANDYRLPFHVLDESNPRSNPRIPVAE